MEMNGGGTGSKELSSPARDYDFRTEKYFLDKIRQTFGTVLARSGTHDRETFCHELHLVPATRFTRSNKLILLKVCFGNESECVPSSLLVALAEGTRRICFAWQLVGGFRTYNSTTTDVSPLQ